MCASIVFKAKTKGKYEEIFFLRFGFGLLKSCLAANFSEFLKNTNR